VPIHLVPLAPMLLVHHRDRGHSRQQNYQNRGDKTAKVQAWASPNWRMERIYLQVHQLQTTEAWLRLEELRGGSRQDREIQQLSLRLQDSSMPTKQNLLYPQSREKRPRSEKPLIFFMPVMSRGGLLARRRLGHCMIYHPSKKDASSFMPTKDIGINHPQTRML
jgi:hypothetical protein